MGQSRGQLTHSRNPARVGELLAVLSQSAPGLQRAKSLHQQGNNEPGLEHQRGQRNQHCISMRFPQSRRTETHLARGRHTTVVEPPPLHFSPIKDQPVLSAFNHRNGLRASRPDRQHRALGHFRP